MLLVPAPWIKFSHLFVNFTHPFPLYFSKASKHEDFTVISFKCGKWQRDPLGGVLFTLVHFCILHPTITTHPTCVCPSLANDMHIVSHASDVVPICFEITKGVHNIKTFSAIDEMCNLVSTKVKPFYIISSKFFLHMSPVFVFWCSSGFFAICGIFRIKGILGGHQHNI